MLFSLEKEGKLHMNVCEKYLINYLWEVVLYHLVQQVILP